jgi:TRAP-type C4-dicarboxylate transport system permease small subunit
MDALGIRNRAGAEGREDVQTISKVHDWVLNAMKAGAEIVVFAVFVVIVIDVGLTLLSGLDIGILPWDRTLGLVEYGLLWFTMLGGPWLLRMKGHVYLDVVTVLLPPAVQKVTSKISYTVAFVGSVTFAYFSAVLLWEAYVDELIDERGADMFQWILYFPMPFAFALMAVEFLRFLFGFDDMYDKRIDVGGSL